MLIRCNCLTVEKEVSQPVVDAVGFLHVGGWWRIELIDEASPLFMFL